MSDPVNFSRIRSSLQGVQDWVERHGYRGYEPFDCLTSYLRPLAFGSLVGEQILQQIGRQSPINLRPILGVRPRESTKGRGFMAWGYGLRFVATGKPEFRSKMEESLDWLDHHKSDKYELHTWGNVFDYASRTGWIPRGEPTIVWTSLIGQVFLQAFELTGEARWLEIADSICRWILALPREHTPDGDCLSYYAFKQTSIHNSNMLGAAVLARTAKHTGNAEYLKVARSAMAYSVAGQHSAGSWYYGEDPKHHWIDNFHTGYNLDSLKRYTEYSGDETWSGNLRLGLDYFKANFFEADGCPKYYNSRRYPLDIQCAAQAIDTLSLFSSYDPSCYDIALKTAEWTIKHMQGRDGHFYYRIYPLMKARVAMIHWGQATMFKALSHLEAIEASRRAGAASLVNGQVAG